jgi:hypothetical protein
MIPIPLLKPRVLSLSVRLLALEPGSAAGECDARGKVVVSVRWAARALD